MSEKLIVNPEDLIEIYPPGCDPEIESPAYIGIAWHRLGLCRGEKAAKAFGTYRTLSEHPDLLDNERASEAEAAFISMLGFSPADLLATLYATEHSYNFPPTYNKGISSTYWARVANEDSD